MPHRGGSRLLGRSHEMAALLALLDRAEHDRADPLLVVGEAGMGKTALLDEFARAARRRGIRVVRAAAPQGSEATPFGVIDDLARGLGDILSTLPDENAAVLRGLACAVPASPGTVAVGLLHLLAEAAQHDRLLLLVDDVHWADPGSLAALCLAVGRLQVEPIAVIATARPRPPVDPRLLSWPQLDIGPLDVDAAVTLLRSALPAEPALDATQARRVVTALGCCPLAIVEAPRVLSTEQLADPAALPDPLPMDDRLTQAWGDAWAELPDRTAAALLALCVAEGSGTRLVEGVWATLGVGGDDLAPALTSRLLSRPDPTRPPDLAHPLIRDAILASAGPDRVRAMHAQVARVAADLDAAPSVVIAHLSAGVRSGDRTVVGHLERWAEQALADGVAEAATQALIKAAALADGPHRSRLAAQAARIMLTQAMTLPEAWSQQILDLADPSVLPVEDRLWLAWLHAESLAMTSIRAHMMALESATALARQVGSPVAGWMLLSSVDAGWRMRDRAAIIRNTAALRDWLDHEYRDEDALVPAWACLMWVAASEFQVGNVVESYHVQTTARAASRAWKPPIGRDLSQELAVLVAERCVGYPDPWMDARLAELARRLQGEPGETLGFLRGLQAEHALTRGDLPQARALIDDVVAMVRATGSHLILDDALAMAAGIAAAQGDRAEFDRCSNEVQHYAATNGNRTLDISIARAGGLLALGEGRLDEALASLEPLADGRLLGVGPGRGTVMGRGDLVEALVRSGERERAKDVAAGLVAALGPSPDPVCRALVARVQALVADGEQAVALLRGAIECFTEIGDQFETGRTRLLLGARLRRERRVQESRHELRLAAADLTRIGAAPWAHQAIEELRATGARVTHEARDPWASLTPQERRVATAVASGGTDRQVAAELFLSPRTVAYHLSSVYRKLGISSRAALASRLAHTRSGRPPDGVADRELAASEPGGHPERGPLP